MTLPAVVLPAKPPRHYPTPAAKCADLVVHMIGLTLALVGGIVLLAFAVRAGSISARGRAIWGRRLREYRVLRRVR